MIFRKLLIGIFFFTTIAYSQQDIKFERISTRNGLSHNSVLSIFQDSKGFMWFGTYGGLNKYDGYKFTNYKTEYGVKNSLYTNPIVSVFEDSEGLIWLGTFGGGVIRFNPQTEVFTDFKNMHLAANNKLSINVRSIYEDEDGFIWFASSEGLVKFDKKENKFSSFKVKSEVHADNNIVTIHKGFSGKLWIGSYLGVKLFDKKTGTFESFKPDPSNENSLSHPNVMALYEDKQGILWIGTEGGGLNKFDPKTGVFEHFLNNPSDNNTINNNIVYDIKPIEYNKLWIATEVGINVLDLATGVFHHIINDPKINTSLSNNTVRCLFKDDGGVLWIGTDGGGINKTDTQRKKFNLYQNDTNNPNTLASNNIFSIVAGNNSDIWFGTIGGGLDKFNPSTKHFTHFFPDAKDIHSISSAKILSLSFGPSKNLWIGTDRDGLCMLPSKFMNGNTKPFFYKYYSDPKPNALKSNVIYSVLEDHSGVVWAGSWSRGLHKIVFDKTLNNGEPDYQNPTITNFRNNINDSTSLAQDIAFTLYEDKKGSLWIGTAGKGLDKHVTIKKEIEGRVQQQDAFIHYINNPDDSTSLSNNNVSVMYESRNGDFWVGTSLGLNKMNREKGTFKVYSTRNGLPDNVVFGILEDAHGNLWLATLGGLSKFDPKKETFTNYTYEDGLQDNMFNPHAYCVGANGEMYFGGPNGVTSFLPDSIKDNPFKPQVMLTDFKIFNQSVLIGTHSDSREHISTSIASASLVELSYKDYVFSFEFSSSSYAIPSKNQFAYKMDGFDNNWVYTDAKNRTATYTNLNPGVYTFKVKASNCDGVWSTAERTIKIHILPPFWGTLWFRTLALLSILGLLFTIFRMRVTNIERQKKDLESQVSQRTKEILQQKEEIESQKENIEEKNMILEKQYLQIEEARKEIKKKNEQLREYNATLENSVRERTEQLRQTFNNLAQTNKELDQFVYRSAHDLKGPLARITGLCYLGSLETKDPQILELFKRMENTTEEMTNKLSRLMKIHEFNAVELTVTNINYNALLTEVLADIKAQYDCRDIEVIIKVDSQVKCRSDKDLIKTLLKNLIENSVKYKDEHKTNRYIHINVRAINTLTEISIADNGIGIPHNQAERVFDLFVTATENIQGFGLGLYEAKLIARRLNGNIQLNYPDNGDTEFVITL